MTVKKCDVCGSVLNVETHCMPLYKMHDSSDGLTRYQHPVINFKDIDICQDCLQKSINIYDDTVMGYGNFSISTNPELIKK